MDSMLTVGVSSKEVSQTMDDIIRFMRAVYEYRVSDVVAVALLEKMSFSVGDVSINHCSFINNPKESEQEEEGDPLDY